MKKFWLKVLVFLVVIWALGAIISAIGVNRYGATITGGSPSRARIFRLVVDTLNSCPNPRIRSESAVVVDLADGRVLLKKNESDVRPIASLTKLATALAFLSIKPDLTKTITIEKADRAGAGRSRLYSGSQVSLNDIFHLMLICSDNVAARVLARSIGLTQGEFVDRMNQMARELNLNCTHFAEPTGLDPANVSTAADCAVLLKAALDNPLIAGVMSRKDYSFKPQNRKRVYTVNNTNRMLFGRADIIGGKTGYICESGYCLALGADLGGRKLATVVLGAPTSGTRFHDAARLLSSIPALRSVAAN